MDTRKIIGLEPKTLQNIEEIHKFVCETGLALKEPEVQSYVSHLPEINQRYPGDILHKILFI